MARDPYGIRQPPLRSASARQFDPARFRAAAARQRTLSGTPVPGRITQALNLRGLYGPEVDLACGAAEPDVDRWEAGELVPTRAQVLALAALTGFPPEFFYHPLCPSPAPVWLCTGEVSDGGPGFEDQLQLF